MVAEGKKGMINKLALVLLSLVVLELILVGDQVQPVKAIKKKIYLKKLKKLLPLFALIKPKKKIILLPVPIPMKGNNRYTTPAMPTQHQQIPDSQYTSPMTMASMSIGASSSSSLSNSMLDTWPSAMPAIIHMSPASLSNNSYSMPGAMTMTIHAPAEDALRCQQCQPQNLTRAPLIDAGQQYYSSPWKTSRAPLPSPARIYQMSRAQLRREPQSAPPLQALQQQHQYAHTSQQHQQPQYQEQQQQEPPQHQLLNQPQFQVRTFQMRSPQAQQLRKSSAGQQMRLAESLMSAGQTALNVSEIEELVPVGPAHIMPVYQTQNGQLHMSPPTHIAVNDDGFDARQRPPTGANLHVGSINDEVTINNNNNNNNQHPHQQQQQQHHHSKQPSPARKSPVMSGGYRR